MEKLNSTITNLARARQTANNTYSAAIASGDGQAMFESGMSVSRVNNFINKLAPVNQFVSDYPTAGKSDEFVSAVEPLLAAANSGDSVPFQGALSQVNSIIKDVENHPGNILYQPALDVAGADGEVSDAEAIAANNLIGLE